MSGWSRFVHSSIGLKYIMAISGLMLSGFVLVHMSGNLLIFAGSDTYNKYSHSLTSNPAIWLARAGLILFFGSHIVNGFLVSIRNRVARPGGNYAVQPVDAKSASLASRTMIYQGVLILIFLVLHLLTFSLGKYYSTQVGGVEMRDIYRLAIEIFQSPFYVGWYIFSLIILGFHLSHGFSSCIQSLGLHHPKYTPAIKCIGVIYAWFVSLGFMALPIYVLFFAAK